MYIYECGVIYMVLVGVCVVVGVGGWQSSPYGGCGCFELTLMGVVW